MEKANRFTEAVMGFFKDPADTLSEQGAHLLAAQIKAYWAGKGREIKTRVELVAPYYVVRSNMVRGLPPAEA